jgi:hypothetical protein
VDEVERPARIDLGFDQNRRPCSHGSTTRLTLADSQSFLSIEPVNAIDAWPLALFPQQDEQPPITEPAALIAPRGFPASGYSALVSATLATSMGPWTLPLADDLSRDVYCVLGIPIDAIDMAAALRRIEAAADSAVPFFISTPNLNFLVNSQVDPEFRESLMLSDLCPADGMPIVWIARLLGLPIKERVPGSGMFEALKTSPDRKRSLACTRFRRHRVRCFTGTGGGSWRGGSLSLKRCG